MIISVPLCQFRRNRHLLQCLINRKMKTHRDCGSPWDKVKGTSRIRVNSEEHKVQMRIKWTKLCHRSRGGIDKNTTEWRSVFGGVDWIVKRGEGSRMNG